MKGYIKRTDGIITQYKCKVCGEIYTPINKYDKGVIKIMKEHRQLHKLKYNGHN
jgi:uncharacterized OB-fold protein